MNEKEEDPLSDETQGLTRPLVSQDDPLSHEIAMPRWRWVRTAVLAVTLAPLRMVLICLTVLVGWAVASVGLWGLSDEELAAQPLDPWRRQLKAALRVLGRLTLRFGGLHSVKVIGRRATREEAPILVVAPHSTFFDALAALWDDDRHNRETPYIVSRAENLRAPLLGKILKFAQAVSVSREDPESRQRAKLEIIRRAESREEEGGGADGAGRGWPQLMIFPEGSTSNRRALMTFAPGAFNPGKPVQPVLIRFPNAVDTVTWTWNQPHGALAVLWYTLSQPFTRAEVEYLAPYRPSEEERADPKLFAGNVRGVFAAALGVPASDVNFKEAKEMYGRKRRSKSAKRA